MAADEPPFLTIGTDVSAKYKGAFCEAKVKKVNKIVKCKVTFKNNLGSFVVTDDLIKTGSLRIGADVEAKHPDKNGYYDAVINKLQDYSQYTVVFDDGDETTLRRSSLCLKSGRHFAESPTLDQFPLTNPEHFGTPVIGSGKFKRKRRSTVNSSLDYESSDDEDSLPRKLKAIRGKDPDLGKVVCVDFGDRRKKDNWYPGLIVPLPPQSNIKISKDEHLIRSFKDGKYYQVPKRDIREFTKECGQKVENNSLRSAVEKATLYLEKEELPPHWDKVLFIGLDDDESNEFESDTSDDEPSEEKDRFVAQLYKFMDERGTPINKAPTVSNRDLNLYKLFKIMHKLGGYNKVTNKNKWKTVYLKMGLPHSVTNGPNQVKFAYKRYLQSFEDFYRKLGCTMVNNTRSTRGRHRSDRNIIITRTRDRDGTSPKSKATKETKEKTAEKKVEEKSKPADKKDGNKLEESTKPDEKAKNADKKKLEDEKKKKEDKRKSTKKEEDSKPEKARTREDARKEKNDSPEKKGTRSSLKMESDKKPKEEAPKEKKIVKEKKDEKLAKEEKPKPNKKEEIPKEKKVVREKKVEDKVTKEKRENPVREKRDLSREKKDAKEIEKPKGKKEEPKTNAESPKRKLERNMKKDLNKSKSEEPEEAEKIEETSEQLIKKVKCKVEDSPFVEEESLTKLEDDALAEDRKSKQFFDEPPNKSKKKSIKGDEKEEKESPFDFSDSDDSLTYDPEKSKDLKKEIEVGDRVKVKYGRGRMQKVYEAKVLKTDTDGLEKRYYVHYAGWNMRYDEWVRKSYIVAIINGSKKFEGSSKNLLPPSSMKKRLPGPKSVRKMSTSSSNSNVSRSTRSDKKEDAEAKTKSSKGNTSQESDSEREDVEEVEEQTDCCFKEDLFTDDEEKDKFEDTKDARIAELDKALEQDLKPTCSDDAEDLVSENKFITAIKIEDDLKQQPDVCVEKEEILKLSSDEKMPLKEIEVTEEPQTASAISTDSLLEEKPLPEDIMQTPDIATNKLSVLSFSGLIHKTENLIPMAPSIFSEPMNVSETSNIKCEVNERQLESDVKTQNSESNEESSLSGKTDCLEANDSIDSSRITETSLPCSETKDDQVTKEQNIFVPSFSPQNLDQSLNKLRSEDHTVDVSKMIPGILERLKNDVVDEPSPQKSELPFDFLRDNKCMSRSESSSSLRICESDTNDSNNDSKDVGSAFLIESCQAFDALPKTEIEHSSKISSAESSEKSTESVAMTTESIASEETDKSTSNSELVEIASIKEQTLNVESSNAEKIECLQPSCTIDYEGTRYSNSDTPNTDFIPKKSSEDSLIKDEVSEDLRAISSDSPREISDSVPTSSVGFSGSASQESKEPQQMLDLPPCSKEDAVPYDNLKNMSFAIKKGGKKKKFSKKFGKKSCAELLEKDSSDSKMNKSKIKKKMRFGGFSNERMKSLDLKLKSKKLKKNKNKKRFKHEEASDIKKVDGDENKDFDKLKKKEKKKCDKKLFKCGSKSEDCFDPKMDLLKKKKMKKNREKLLNERKDYIEKKAKKKRKLPPDHNQDTDSDKDIFPKVEKKRKKKKPKTKGCSSSDDGTDKFFKEETLEVASSSSMKQDVRTDDPDMSFLLCEEKVPASPVGNLLNDSSDSSSMEENSSGLMNNTSTVMDNTPPTTPSSTESLLSSSPSHERDSFPYPESTQSGRESCESDLFRCGSNRTISRGSEEYHAATTLAFDVCQTVSEKLPPSDLLKQPSKSESSDLTKRKKISKRFRRMSESAKSPKHRLSFLRTSKIEHYYEESSGTSLATLSSSPPYGSLSFSRSLPTSEDMLHMNLHEKDPEKRIALLQKKMSDLRKHYLSLRAEVIAIDHKRRKARKKIRETVGFTTAPSPHSDDGHSCS